MGEHLAQQFKDFKISHLDLEEIPKVLCNRLSNLDFPKPWLLIYDNFNKPIPSMQVPERGGYVLITSRREDVWFPQKETKNEIGPLKKPVGPFKLEEATQLLQEITGEQNNQEVQLLAEDLNRFPFAINLVAHYIKNSPRQSITKYRALYTQHNKTVDAPMEKDSERGYTHTLRTVWKATLDDLRDESPQTIEWLGLCSYLHYNGIPGAWLDQWVKKPQDSDNISRHLGNYALMKFNPQNDTYSMHQLMQEVVRLENKEKKLASDQQDFQKTFYFLKEMGKEAEMDNEPEQICKKIGSKIGKEWFLNLSLFYENKEIDDFENKKALIDGIKSLTAYSIYYLSDYNSSRHFSEQGLAMSRQIKDEQTEALFLDRLGNAYAIASKYKDVERNHQQSLELKVKLFGEESLRVKYTRAGLAQTAIYIGQQEQDKNKIQNGLSDLEACLKALENEKFNTNIAQFLNTVNDALYFLADMEQDLQKKQQLREQSLRKDMEFLELVTKFPLPDPMSIVVSNRSIGMDLMVLKRYEEALNYLQTAENMMETLNKKDSLHMRNILLSMSQCQYEIALNSTVPLEREQGLEKAKSNVLKSLDIVYKNHLSEDDVLVADHQHELGKISMALNNPQQAIEHLTIALKINRKNFDEHHQKVQNTLKTIQEVENQMKKSKTSSCSIL